MPTEVLVGKGSMRFQVFLAAMLADAGIQSRVLTVDQMPNDLGQRWSGDPAFEAGYLIVETLDEQAAKAAIEYTIWNCKICLYCDASFVKPGESICPRCGVALDPRDPDQVRTQYLKDCLEATRA